MAEVSVALATRDGARHLPALLATLGAQERRPDELVVHDDGSLDETPAILRRFAEDAPFSVRVERDEVARGPVAAFERALDATSGDLVALCDQDDLWYPDKLSTVLRAGADPAVTVVISDADLVDDRGQELPGSLWGELEVHPPDRRRLVESPPGPVLHHAITAGCALAVSRRVLEVALPFPDVLGAPAHPVLHDRWLSMVGACLGQVRLVDRPLLAYRRHPGQAVGARRVSPLDELRTQAERRMVEVRAVAVARERQLAVLEERVGDAGAAAGVVGRIRAVRRHLLARSEVPDARRHRLTAVRRAARSGGYGLAGSPRGAAVLDLLRAP